MIIFIHISKCNLTLVFLMHSTAKRNQYFNFSVPSGFEQIHCQNTSAELTRTINTAPSPNLS